MTLFVFPGPLGFYTFVRTGDWDAPQPPLVDFDFEVLRFAHRNRVVQQSVVQLHVRTSAPCHRNREATENLCIGQRSLDHNRKRSLFLSMKGANSNFLEWLELEEEEDDENDAQTSEWNGASIPQGEITILGPTKKTRKLRPSTLEPIPPTPKPERPCFTMNWILHWLTNISKTPQRPLNVLVLETVSPVGVSVSATQTSKRTEVAIPEESCCSTAASSIADDPDNNTLKLLNSTTEMPPALSLVHQDHRFQGQGWIAEDHVYQEYLTTKYRTR